jgi:hypothetical protein
MLPASIRVLEPSDAVAATRTASDEVKARRVEWFEMSLAINVLEHLQGGSILYSRSMSVDSRRLIDRRFS